MFRYLLFCLIFGALPIVAKAQSSSISDFWTWVQLNELAIANDPNLLTRLDEIGEQLDQVAPGLTFEVGGYPGVGREFVISADGIIANAQTVIDLVNAAPELEALMVIAFRQPKQGFDLNELAINGTLLRAQDLTFSYTPYENRLDLVLFHESFQGETREAAISIAFLHLDAAIGEFQVMTDIGRIDFVSFDAALTNVERHTFEKLPLVYGEYLNNKN